MAAQAHSGSPGKSALMFDLNPPGDMRMVRVASVDRKVVRVPSNERSWAPRMQAKPEGMHRGYKNFHEVLQELAMVHELDISHARAESRFRGLGGESHVAPPRPNSAMPGSAHRDASFPFPEAPAPPSMQPPTLQPLQRSSQATRVTTPESGCPGGCPGELRSPSPSSRASCASPRISDGEGEMVEDEEVIQTRTGDLELETGETSRRIPRGSDTKEFSTLSVWRTDPATLSKKFQLCRSVTMNFTPGQRNTKQLSLRREKESTLRGNSWLQSFVVHPSSGKRLCWDVVCMGLLAWDIVMIPFTGAFNPEVTPLIGFMNWFTMLFWSLDMVASVLTGFQEGRYTVMLPSRILRRYAWTWFPLDALIVSLDWTLFFLGENGESAGSAARLGRSLRTLRFVRTLRLVRLLKIKRILHEIQDQINTEALSICFGILKIILVLVLANHIMACSWYGIGEFTANDDIVAGGSWVIENGMEGRTLMYKYSTSLHWSLTQFTPASMEVVPKNVLERVFSVIVLLFAMITFSSFLSILTASMAELRNITSDETRQFWLLRRYLRDWNVSRRFGLRIQRYLEYAYQKQRQRVQAKDVKLLALLSGPLHDELKYETLHVHLAIHPLFQHCESGVRVFANSLSEMYLARGDCLFCCGEQASCMFFLSAGAFQYHLGDAMDTGPPPSDGEAETVHSGQWVAEAVLWTQWLHLGDLVALTESQILTINGYLFSQAVQVHQPMWLGFREYAVKFVQALNDVPREELTDLLHLVMSMEGIVEDSGFVQSQPSDAEEEVSETALRKLGRSLWRKANDRVSVFVSRPETPGEDDSCGSD